MRCWICHQTSQTIYDLESKLGALLVDYLVTLCNPLTLHRQPELHFSSCQVRFLAENLARERRQ